jgi:hypothetical protein
MLIRIVEKHNNCFLKSRDQRRKGEINNLTSAIVSAPKTDKITIHANMEPRLWISALESYSSLSHVTEYSPHLGSTSCPTLTEGHVANPSVVLSIFISDKFGSRPQLYW